MSTSIKAITTADSEAIASCNATAFYNDQHWRHQNGTTPLSEIIRTTALRTPWTLSTSRHRLRCLKVVDDNTGELVAYARWILPPSMVGNDSIWPEALIAEPTKEQFALFEKDYQSTVDPHTGASRGVNMDMVRALGDKPDILDGEIRAKYSNREFLELDYLAVRETWQGKGLGKMLVREGINMATHLGCHLIIMGFTEKGKALYSRMPELTFAGEVTQSCEQWPQGRAINCVMTCVAFLVGLGRRGWNESFIDGERDYLKQLIPVGKL